MTILTTTVRMMEAIAPHAVNGGLPGLVDLETGQRYAEDLRDGEKLEAYGHDTLTTARWARACEQITDVLWSRGEIREARGWDAQWQIALMATDAITISGIPKEYGRVSGANRLVNDDGIMREVVLSHVGKRDVLRLFYYWLNHHNGLSGMPHDPGESDFSNGKDGVTTWAMDIAIVLGRADLVEGMIRFSLATQHACGGWPERFDEDLKPMSARSWEPATVSFGSQDDVPVVSVPATAHHLRLLVQGMDFLNNRGVSTNIDYRKGALAVFHARTWLIDHKGSDNQWPRFHAAIGARSTPVYIGKSGTAYREPGNVPKTDLPPGIKYRDEYEGVDIIPQWRSNFSNNLSPMDRPSFPLHILLDVYGGWLHQWEPFEWPTVSRDDYAKYAQHTYDRWLQSDGLLHHITGKPHIINFRVTLQHILQQAIPYLEGDTTNGS